MDAVKANGNEATKEPKNSTTDIRTSIRVQSNSSTKDKRLPIKVKKSRMYQ